MSSAIALADCAPHAILFQRLEHDPIEFAF